MSDACHTAISHQALIAWAKRFRAHYTTVTQTRTHYVVTLTRPWLRRILADQCTPSGSTLHVSSRSAGLSVGPTARRTCWSRGRGAPPSYLLAFVSLASMADSSPMAVRMTMSALG